MAPAVQERRQPEPLHQIADNSIHRRAGRASQRESIFEILSHRAAKQDRPLFDQRDTASQRRAGAFRDQRPAEENLTLGWRLEERKQPKQCALAGAIMPDDGEQGTARHNELVEIENETAVIAMADATQLKHARDPAGLEGQRSRVGP